jgi:hypothetical protein
VQCPPGQLVTQQTRSGLILLRFKPSNVGVAGRASVDCATAVAVGATFYMMSQMSGAVLDGVIVPGGPAMAGLVMLALWSAVALPTPGELDP